MSNLTRRGLKALKEGVKTLVQEWSLERHPIVTESSVTEVMSTAAKQLRGERKPAILIHGVMPRSGTVYVGNLLWEHPHLTGYPNELWETPFLETVPQVLAVQKTFVGFV